MVAGRSGRPLEMLLDNGRCKGERGVSHAHMFPTILG